MEKEFIPFSMFYNDATMDNITRDMAKEYRSGTEKRLKSYVKQKYPNEISYDDNGELLVSRDFLDDAEKANDLKNFFQYKEGTDFSVEDTVKWLLTHTGIPPIETMKLDSFEKKIREFFNSSKYKDSVYAKRSGKKGGHSVACVDRDTFQKLERDESVRDLIRRKIDKAERNNKDSDSVAWKLYCDEKSEIEYYNEQADRYEAGQIDDDEPLLSTQEKTLCMLQEIFSLFFTDVPFRIHELYKDKSEYNMVWSLFSYFFTDIDFELFLKELEEYIYPEVNENNYKRHQELEEIFNSPHFGWRYYKVKENRIREIEDAFLDRLAEKIVAKLNQAKGNEG